MKWLHAVMIATALGFCGDRAFTLAQGEIGLVGQFLGDGPWAGWSGRWLALLPRDEGFEFREVTVSGTREKPVCGDVGFVVQVPGVKRDTLLVRGFPTLKPGPVVVAFHGQKFLLPGERLDLSLGGGADWSLRAFGIVRPAVGAGRGEALITNYEVQLTGSGRAAAVFRLARVGNDGPPRILWAGDLDGDRVADLLADLQGYPGHHYALFLSSIAPTSKLVAEAASLIVNGC
jgi:hypothetical protein